MQSLYWWRCSSATGSLLSPRQGIWSLPAHLRNNLLTNNYNKWLSFFCLFILWTAESRSVARLLGFCGNSRVHPLRIVDLSPHRRPERSWLAPPSQVTVVCHTETGVSMFVCVTQKQVCLCLSLSHRNRCDCVCLCHIETGMSVCLCPTETGVSVFVSCLPLQHCCYLWMWFV